MLSELFLHTKLVPPPARPQLVARTRLTEKIAQAPLFPLTLISAPAGFGKTTATVTAVQALSEASGIHLAWLTLEAHDDDPVRFWYYFLAAVETAVPLVPSLAETLNQPQPPPLPALLTALLNQLAGQPGDLLLVLDDLHHLTDAEIYDGLAFLLDHAPVNLHLVLVSRVDPLLPLHRLRARGQILEIRAADLRFNSAEAAEFLHHVLALDLSEEAAALLTAQTEGWAAGLQLSALAMPATRAEQQAFIGRLAHNNRYILEYLTEEVLAQQPVAVRAFLQQTAVLEHLCAPLCDAVTQRADSQAMLAYLAQRNLFIQPVHAPATAVDLPWFRYHHLFAALLQGHLRQQQPDQVAGLHRRAALWFAEQNAMETAVHHALAAADYALAANLLESHANEIVMQGRARLMEGWLRRLPPEALLALPRANLAFAQALLLRGQFSQAEPFLQRAEASELAAADPAFRGQVHGLYASLLGTQGQTEEALAYARRAIDNMPADDIVLQALAHFALASALRETGDVEAAATAYDRAIPLCHAARLTLLEMLARAHFCFLCILRGKLNRAAAAARSPITAGMNHPAVASAYAVLSMIYLEWDRLQEAEQFLRQAEDLVRDSGHNAAAVHCQVIRARLQMARSDFAGAQQALEKAAALFEHGAPSWLEPLLRDQQVKFWLAQGDAALATAVLALADNRPSVYAEEQLWLAQARIDLFQGTPAALAAARALLDRVLETAVTHDRHGLALEARLLRALVGAARGEAQAAVEDLRRCLALAEPEGYVRLFVDAGQPMAALLTAVAHPYAQQLLAHFPETLHPVADTTVALSPLPEPLTEREADVLRLMAAGLTYQQIADQLIISVNTVRHHVKGLYAKLAVGSRAQAVATAQALDLL